jgi:hypothetical protein
VLGLEGLSARPASAGRSSHYMDVKQLYVSLGLPRRDAERDAARQASVARHAARVGTRHSCAPLPVAKEAAGSVS